MVRNKGSQKYECKKQKGYIKIVYRIERPKVDDIMKTFKFNQDTSLSMFDEN